MKILVTGSNGFVGQALCMRLEAEGNIVRRVVRQSTGLTDEIPMGNIDGNTNWRTALMDCDAIVHLAARTHVIHETAKNPLKLYRTTNTAATLNLAHQAAQAKVKRFIFISSIKVNGEGSNKAYQETDAPASKDVYAISKWEAEQHLCQIIRDTELEVVILRPPLIYGPGVGANFLRLIRIVDRGLPLPLGSIQNQRSLIYLGNLVNAIIVCLIHPAAVGKTYLISDGENISTPELIRRIAAALEQPAHLLPVPSRWIKIAGWLLGKRAVTERLLGSLTVDSTLIRQELAWIPPYTLQDGLETTVTWYCQKKLGHFPNQR